MSLKDYSKWQGYYFRVWNKQNREEIILEEILKNQLIKFVIKMD